MSNVPPDRADWFLDEIVWPTVNEFLTEPSSIRHGVLAAAVVGSLADYIYVERPTLRNGATKVEVFREKLGLLSQDYALVRDVGDAAKHAQLTRRSARLTNIQHVKQGVEQLLGADGAMLIGEDGKYLTSAERVVAVMPGGQEESLEQAIRGAVQFLETWMGRP